MTNGQVTIDINVQRIHVKDCALRQNILQSTTSEEDVFLDSATAQQVPPQYPQHPQHQRSSFGDDGQGDQEWLPKIYYKTIALHIPRKLAPITFMIFSGGAMAGIGPIRRRDAVALHLPLSPLQKNLLIFDSGGMAPLG